MSALDLGRGHALTPRHLDGVLHGFEYWHQCLDGPYEGWLPVRTPDGWTLTEERPVSLSPSVLCPRCQDHGWVTAGAWVPC